MSKGMRWLTPDLHVKTVPKAGWWVVTVELQFGDHVVPVGTLTDFASVPRVLRPFCNINGIHRRAAVLHDHHYTIKYATRKECDKIFYKALLGCDVPKWQARIFYRGVRVGGWTRGNW